MGLVVLLTVIDVWQVVNIHAGTPVMRSAILAATAALALHLRHVVFALVSSRREPASQCNHA